MSYDEPRLLKLSRWGMGAILWFSIGSAALEGDERILSKIKTGLNVKEFNSVRLSNRRIARSESRQYLTSYGVVEVPHAIQTTPFHFRKTKMWESGLVKFNQNRLVYFSSINSHGTAEKTEKVFSEMADVLGDDYFSYRFVSFGKDGVALQWLREDTEITLKLSKPLEDRWTYQLIIQLQDKTAEPKAWLDPESEFALAILRPILKSREGDELATLWQE